MPVQLKDESADTRVGATAADRGGGVDIERVWLGAASLGLLGVSWPICVLVGPVQH